MDLKLYRILLIAIPLLFIIVLNLIMRNEIETSIIDSTTSALNYKLPNFNSSKKCKPIYENIVQTYIKINGETYPKSVPIILNSSINFECLNSNRLKTILFWEMPDWYKKENLGVREPFIRQNCPVTNCEVTNDASKYNQSDFIVTHMWQDIRKPPSYRLAHQRWIFMLYESPIRTFYDFSIWKNFFNMTSTYMVNSDLPGFYESMSNMYWKENKTFDENFNFYGSKSNFAAAVISNCGGPSQRLKYINELKRFINVDVYGKCGKPCPTHFKNNIAGDCKEIISAEYKFYLAFENSVCKDYITEKFFGILRNNIIPVVLGGGSYDHYVYLKSL